MKLSPKRLFILLALACVASCGGQTGSIPGLSATPATAVSPSRDTGGQAGERSGVQSSSSALVRPTMKAATICPYLVKHGTGLQAIQPQLTCCQQTGDCPTPTPRPTATPHSYSNSMDHSRKSMEWVASSGSDLVLHPGQTGTLSFVCLLVDASTGATIACDNGTTEQWLIVSPFGAGITEAWNPPSTIGEQYSALTMTPSLATNPGTYTTTVQANISATDQNVANYLSPPATLTLVVAKATPSAAAKGPFNDAIFAASNAAFGESTSSGPACADGDYAGVGGSCACAWEVNRILNRAGVSTIGANPDYVPSVESSLESTRGLLVPLSSALPGDLIVENSQGHIGICMTNQCTSVYSNSTSKQTYSDITGPDIFESTPGRVYRVEN